MLVALSLLGYRAEECFRVVVGGSTGAYFGTCAVLGHEALIALAHLLMEGARKKLYFDPLRWDYPISTVYVEKPFRKLILSKYPNAIQNSATAIYYAVTNRDTGEVEL